MTQRSYALDVVALKQGFSNIFPDPNYVVWKPLLEYIESLNISIDYLFLNQEIIGGVGWLECYAPYIL